MPRTATLGLTLAGATILLTGCSTSGGHADAKPTDSGYFSYSPIPDDQGGVGGMLCVVTEDTERTIGERRLRALRELAARTTEQAKSAEEACQTATRTLAENRHDLPFVLIYLLDPDGKTARLAGATGLPEAALLDVVAEDLIHGRRT